MTLRIRELQKDDGLELFSIRNHPTNYQWFFSQSPIDIEEHVNWVKNRIENYSSFTLVATLGERVIGICYLGDPNDESPEVSINVSPDFKGIGVGSSLLEELIDKASAAQIGALIARIMINNLDSIAFFRNKGFVEIKKQNPGTIELTLSL